MNNIWDPCSGLTTFAPWVPPSCVIPDGTIGQDQGRCHAPAVDVLCETPFLPIPGDCPNASYEAGIKPDGSMGIITQIFDTNCLAILDTFGNQILGFEN